MDRIIDCHVHVGRVDQWEIDLDYTALQEHVSKQAIVKTVIFPILTQFLDDPALNDPLFEIMKRDRRFILFPWVNPSLRRPEDMERLLRYLEANRPFIKGLKFHPSISQMGFDDPFLNPLMELADKNGWGWIIHSGRHDLSDAQRVFERARRYKQSFFIIAHLGGGVYDKIMECIHFYKEKGMPENLFFDSSQTTHSVLVKRFVDTFGTTKLIFGSDIPFLDFELVKHTILTHHFRSADLENIFHKNFESLTGITEADYAAP